MKLLFALMVLLIPVGAHAQTAAVLLSQEKQDTKCTKPDRTLIRQETAFGIVWSAETSGSKKYNEQAKGFNDCTRVYIDNANREVARIRDEAKTKLDRIGVDATAHIRIIERQINAAIEEVKTVDRLEPVSPAGFRTADDAGAFPPPDCRLPDGKLVIPLPRARDNSARDRKYDDQKQAYAACMRDWIAQAKAEIRQIDTYAHADMKPLVEDANRQIIEINATILAALETAETASLEQATALNQLKASLAPPPPPAEPAGTENVVVTDMRLPRQTDSPSGVGDPDAIVCRSRQQLPGSRRWGPEICRRNRDWADLYKRGVQISSDGLTLVDAEKQRTLKPQTCITRVTTDRFGFPLTTSECLGAP